MLKNFLSCISFEEYLVNYKFEEKYLVNYKFSNNLVNYKF